MFKLSKESKSILADFESKAPVGSSAKINDGLVTIALAEATLCFCPPDIWYGNLFNIPSIPKLFATFLIRASISLGFLPCIVKAKAIFS